ncbi:MAG: sensor domain-containing protein [Halobellus sp.]|uniref:sensor domain-containing protein n=1 Tax=Halobellus sp. TaxID=1979212 RepID=UPI0035D4AAD8
MNRALRTGPGTVLKQFFGVPFRKQTYRNIAYLALAFPLGLLYFVGLSVGLSTGSSLLVTVVGVPLLVLTLVAAVGAAGFEAKLARWLVDVDATPPAALETLDWNVDSLDDLLTTTKQFLTEPSTWTGLLLVGLKFVFGIVAFTALVTAGTLGAVLLTTPVFYDAAGVSYTIGPYLIDTLGEAIAVSGLGVFVVLVSLHVLNGLAKLGGYTTAVLLGADGETESEGA